MNPSTIVIIGGAVAGPAAAARAREINEKARIILIERNRDVSYAAGALGLYLSGETKSIDDLNYQREDFFRDVYNIEVWTYTSVDKIEAAAHTLHIDRNGEKQNIKYDTLVFALGASSRMPERLANAENAVCFRTIKDLEAIEKNLTNGNRVCVLGSGPLGLDATDALLRRKAEVTLIEREDRVFPDADWFISASLAQALKDRCTLATGVTVSSYDMDGARVKALQLSDGRKIECDLVIVATGIEPRTQLLADAGAKLEGNGTVHVDRHCKTNLPDVYACGVCISVNHVVSGRPIWMAQASLADRSAQIAGANAAGLSMELHPATGTYLLRVLDRHFGWSGLTHARAFEEFGSAARSIVVVAPAREPRVQDENMLTVQLTFHNADGRVLGIAVSGTDGVDKRLDAGATAIAGGLTVERLSTLDLAYSPTFNATRDPLNVAATVASLERAGMCRSLSGTQFMGDDLKNSLCLDVSAAPGAIPMNNGKQIMHIPLEELRRRISEINGQSDIVVLSENGRRGYLAARILSSNARSNVRFVAGGTTLLKDLPAKH